MCIYTVTFSKLEAHKSKSHILFVILSSFPCSTLRVSHALKILYLSFVSTMQKPLQVFTCAQDSLLVVRLYHAKNP